MPEWSGLNVERLRLELSRTEPSHIYMRLWPNSDPANEFVEIFPGKSRIPGVGGVLDQTVGILSSAGLLIL